MPESCEGLETLVWQPDAIMDGDLLMYLRAARSMAAFVGWCDGGSTDDGCAAASMDETTINSLHMLHQHVYDTGKALQALVKIINPKSVDKRWSDDDAKKFVRGLKQHGKNFFKIRKELLPNKETPQLVEYYYLWKKTPAAATTRPHRRHRRVPRRQVTPTLPSSNDYMEEMSSASDASGNESYEDTDQGTVPGYTCHQCNTRKSENWHNSGNQKMFCVDCYAFLPKYDDERGTDEAVEPPPFMFRPVKSETDWKHTLPELDKLGMEGKESSSCPETSDEGRPEERTSPSAGSTYSSTSSIAKEVAPNSVAKETASAVKDTIIAAKCCMETGADEAPTKTCPGTPSESLSEASSVFGGENEENEHESEMENNPDEASSGVCSNVPSPSDQYPRPAARLNPKEHDTVSGEPPASGEWSTVEPAPLKEQPEPVEERGKVVSAPDVPPPSAIHSRGQWLGFDSGAPGAQPIVKSEPVYDADLKIKSEVWCDDHDIADHSKRVQLPQYMHPQVPWSEVKGGRDDTKPQRAVASVAPTQLTKQESAETMQAVARVPSPHYSLQPPPPLAPLTMTPALPMAPPLTMPPTPRSEAVTPSMRLSPTAVLQAPTEVAFPLHSPYVQTPTKAVDSYSSQDRRRLMSSSPGMAVAHRDRDRSRSRSRSRSPSRDSDSERDVRRSPSPEPRPVNEEFFRSKSAILVKRWYRGNNTCSRCDLEFHPVAGSKLAHKREDRQAKASSHSSGGTGKVSHGSSGVSSKESRKMELRKEDDKKKPNTPPENRTSDAQITSSLMASHHMSTYGPERLTPRGPYPVGHDPTPALSQLSAYARPHIGGAARDLQRCIPPFGVPSFPPSQSMEPFFRMPGVFPPGSREAMEMEIERDKRENWEREMEYLEKWKDMELKPPGFDRLPPHLGAGAPGPVDQLWADIHRRGLVMQGGPPPGHLASVYPGNLTDLSLMQRERERNEMVRLSHEQQLAASARDSSAAYQFFQRHGQHDPALFQRQINAYLATKAAHENEVMRMIDPSHLVYHFARADPLAGAGPGAAQGASNGLPPHLPPPSHALSPGHTLMLAREQERMCELISRSGYAPDPLMAQQLQVQMAHAHEVLRQQLERDCIANASIMPL